MGVENLGKDYHYAAFISYAHADEAIAKKLHVALETYPLPKGMDKAERAKLFPVFRDVTELTAHHSLSEKIREAVRTSRFLIVLCSPAAKASHWVNEEIKLFRKLHGEGAILAVIVDGVPDTAFPPALTEDGREPLAANMTSKEGFRFGVTQLAASMLGVGLDRLVQRDQRRRRIRTQLATGVSTALALIMGGLAWTAIDARDEAQVAQGKAEVSRNAAEEMVEFMIKDFKEELVPLQKLDLFDSVGKQVLDYYDEIPEGDMDDDRLMRKARSLHVLGEVELNRGNYDAAETILKQAYALSEDVYKRNPENTDALFSHAQSEYWVGRHKYLMTDLNQSLKHFEEYRKYSLLLININPKEVKWVKEAGWGASNIATVYLRTENFEKAEKYYKNAILDFNKALEMTPEDQSLLAELANIYSGASQVQDKIGNSDIALSYKTKSVNLYLGLYSKNKDNNHWKYLYSEARFRLLRFQKKEQCYTDEYSELRKNLKELVSYDPDNQKWAIEEIIQRYYHLKECKHLFENFDDELFSFLNNAAIYQNNKTIQFIIADIQKKLD